MVRPVTKWAKTVYDTKRLAEYTAHAYKMSISGRPGPVYLGFPHEVLYENISSTELDSPQIKTPPNQEMTDETKKSFIQMLEKSSRPIVIAGSGSWYSGASASLKEFVEELDLNFEPNPVELLPPVSWLFKLLNFFILCRFIS